MERFLAMSEKERQAYAQKRAAEMAGQLDQRAAEAAKNGQADKASSDNANASTSRGSGNGLGGRGPRTPDQRLQAQKWRLDNTTPQQPTSERSTMPNWLRRSQRRTPFARGKGCRQFRCRGRDRCELP